MAAKSEGEQKREAYRAEYAVVGSVWQSLQRERFFLVGVFVTTAGVLFGIFSTGTRSVGVSADDAIAATLARNTPLIIMFVLTIFVLLADRALQRAQQVTRGRGAELERLLGLERGLFTQMYQWRMQRLGNMEIREVIAFVIMLICAIAYMWTWWRNDNMVHKPSFTAPSPSWICSYNKVSFLAGKEQLP